LNNLQIGRAARALRHRLGLRQADIAERVGLGHDLVSRIERGRIDGMTVHTLRRLFDGFDAEVVLLIRWRGGELDRVMDRRHATLAETVTERLVRLGWNVLPEVSFSQYGERGSIDLLAWHAPTRTLLVIELKTELTSIEETIRRHDVKERLAATIGLERFGARPAAIARLLVLPDERTPRRHVAAFDNVLRRAYPGRGQSVREWLATPSGPMGGLIFVPSTDGTRLGQRMSPVRRVQRSRAPRLPRQTPSVANRSGT
jgi:transcriptional regulator with XRE-family HTH domain